MGFVTVPLIFEKIAFGGIFAFTWFILLFLAGITSSVSLIQSAISFMEDEFKISRKKTVWIIGIVTFILCQPAIFFLRHGVVDELDFWGGTFCLVLFGTIEVILFAWIFGIDRAWEEIHHGADLNVPAVYKYIIKYITPLFLFFILGFWFIQQGIPIILMKGVSPENKPFVLGTRIMLVGILLVLAILVKIAWDKRKPR